MEESSLLASHVPWEKPAGFPEGLKRKVLRTGADGKPRAALLRLEPGFEMDAHSHDLAEQHYVIEGMYEPSGREYPAGSYHYLPSHIQHGPFRSRAGALLLVVWGD